MLFNENMSLAIVKKIADRDVILWVDEEEIHLELTEEQAQDLQDFVLTQDNLLLPYNKKTKEIFPEITEKWNEQEMEELVEASKNIDLEGKKNDERK
ncbi:hypothetical protein [Metabacillus fastidiosus]|uniref:hypothetical protein n=1 Tax=Metabacillus fastidiosus TaxID=1458 RepID=UPI003D2C55F7